MAIKTLHITNAYHATSGGIGTFYRAMLDDANREKRFVRLVVPAARTHVEEVGEYARIYHVRAPRFPLFDRRYRILLPYHFAPFKSFGTISRILRAERPDLIEICDKYSLIWIAFLIRLGLMRGIRNRPTLVALSCERMEAAVSSFITAGIRGARFSRFWMGNIYAPFFDFHIANSTYTAAEIVEAIDDSVEWRWQGLFDAIWKTMRQTSMPIDERVRVCHKGVDSSHFLPSRRTPEARRHVLDATGGGDERTTRVLLYAGRLSPEKNLVTVVEMMKHLTVTSEDDYRVLVIGSGPLAAWFRDEAARFKTNDRVARLHILEHITDRERLADFYANADVFVHPNPREPFGIAPLEAMASGTPLVVANAGGVLSYANDSNAWLAEPTPEAFAAQVRNVFADDATRARRIAHARLTAERYDWKFRTTDFFKLYDELHLKFTREIPSTSMVGTPRECAEQSHGEKYLDA